MEFAKIKKKLFEVGFDEFYQAGSVNKFHLMNIVAKSSVTNKQYWICVDGGYRCEESFHISHRDIDNSKALNKRIDCKNQSDAKTEFNNLKTKQNKSKIALEFKLKNGDECK
jgi:hypothetical protein